MLKLPLLMIEVLLDLVVVIRRAAYFLLDEGFRDTEGVITSHAAIPGNGRLMPLYAKVGKSPHFLPGFSFKHLALLIVGLMVHDVSSDGLESAKFFIKGGQTVSSDVFALIPFFPLGALNFGLGTGLGSPRSMYVFVVLAACPAILPGIK